MLNSEYEKALLIEDNIKIMKTASYKYSKYMSTEALEQCQLMALWRCMEKHEDGRGCKFTTSLYKYVVWECQRELAKNGKDRKFEHIPDDKAVQDTHIDNSLYLNDLLNKLMPNEQKIIRQRFLDKMTLEEVGHANGYTKESARTKINRALLKLRIIARRGV